MFDMADLLQLIKDTPLGGLLIFLGILTLSVGFGLEFKIGIDVAKMNKTFAKILGSTFLIFGIIHYVSSEQSAFLPLSDPFLVYYLICIPIAVVLCWIVLMFTTGDLQVRATKYIFILIGFLVTIAAIWRIIDIVAYLSDPKNQKIPLGLYVRSSYLPYFILIGVALVIFVCIIFIYTQKPPNLENRIPIYSNTKFCMYLITCRLVWEIVDYIASVNIPGPK